MPARDYQIETRQKTYDYLVQCAQEKKVANGLVCLPTGTGKGYCIADFIYDVMRQWPGQRIMVATHVKELVDQNYKELVGDYSDPTDIKIGLWEAAPAGIFSAGLGRKEHMMPIIFGGVKSIINAITKFRTPDIFIIDEAHLLSPEADTSYQQIIKAFRLINPWMIVIGHTATHWRTGQGLLTEGEHALFKDIIIDLTTMAAWERFVNEGYLVPPIPKRTGVQINTSELHVRRNGEYDQSEAESEADKITYAACCEMVEVAAERKSWLVFAAGVKHSEHVASVLTSMGIEALAVHSKLEKGVRDERIKRFKAGNLRCVVNNNVLTTGFNYPGLDYIGMLRPTMSVGLWVQMLGRGTRPCFIKIGYDLSTIVGRLASIAASHKQDCLVSDFAKNSERLGPINDPCIPRRKRTGTPGLAPIRICPACDTYNHANASVCIECGHIFERQPKIEPVASTAVLFKEPEPQTEMFGVQEISYTVHKKVCDSCNGVGQRLGVECTKCLKTGYSHSMKIEYGLYNTFIRPTMYLQFDMVGGPRNRAVAWWKERSFLEAPRTSVEACNLATNNLRKPKQVMVWLNKRHPEVIGYEW